MVALVVLVRIRAVFRDRDRGRFAVLGAAMVALVAGHLLAGRPIAAFINAGGGLVLAYAWWQLGRRQPPPPAETPS